MSAVLKMYWRHHRASSGGEHQLALLVRSLLPSVLDQFEAVYPGFLLPEMSLSEPRLRRLQQAGQRKRIFSTHFSFLYKTSFG